MSLTKTPPSEQADDEQARSRPVFMPPLRKPTVLLVMSYYSHERHKGVARFAREAGWSLDSWLTRVRGSDEVHLAELEDRKYDGILASSFITAPKLRHMVLHAGVPLVEFSMNYPEDKVARVIFDDYAIGKTAAEYFRSRGFVNCAFYCLEAKSWTSYHRIRGFSETVEAEGAQLFLLNWSERDPKVHTVPLRRQWLATRLLELPKPLAVAATNDEFAIEVLDACELAGLRVPEDVAVLGIDNDELVVDLTRVPLSSVPTNREKIGYEAAALLDRIMKGEPPPSAPIMVPPDRVVTRKSTDILAIRNPYVAMAMSFISNNFAHPISVDDVVAQTAISRRSLQDLFLQHVGRTILDEITRQRLNHAMKLLGHTSLKSTVVARQSGFRSAEWMSKVFRRSVGMTPGHYRRLHRVGDVADEE